ncbi:MAG: Mur ligase, partial [bacterium]|nr:Mur ligase [bacterium]
MELRDSRRLTGPNLFWDRPGAIIDVALNQQEFADPARFEPICLAWENEARRLLDAVGWSAEETTRQCFPVPDGSGHLSLAISAPLDGLYAATEINEWAFQVAVAQAAGQDPAARDEAITRLIAEVSEEANPSLIELRREAIRRGLCFLSDDELVSVGMGQGSMTWGVTEIPEIAAMPWPRLHNIPHVLVTGTNGKSTAVRLLAAMAAAAGRIAGTSSTDWIRIGE